MNFKPLIQCILNINYSTKLTVWFFGSKAADYSWVGVDWARTVLNNLGVWFWKKNNLVHLQSFVLLWALFLSLFDCYLQLRLLECQNISWHHYQLLTTISKLSWQLDSRCWSYSLFQLHFSLALRKRLQICWQYLIWGWHQVVHILLKSAWGGCSIVSRCRILMLKCVGVSKKRKLCCSPVQKF